MRRVNGRGCLSVFNGQVKWDGINNEKAAKEG
jgi:hypothetical protein